MTTAVNFFKTIVINHGFNFKPKTVVTNYDFNFLEKFKTIVTNYCFDDVAIRDLFEHYVEACVNFKLFF